MRKESCFGIIPIKKEGESFFVFLVQHSAGYWAFPKGHSEEKESPRETAERELFEETGLSVVNYLTHPTIKEKYVFTKDQGEIDKEIIYFLAFVEGNSVLQPSEIQKGDWVSLENAVNKITFIESKNMYKKITSLIENSNFKVFTLDSLPDLDKCFLLDLRSPEQYIKGHVERSILLTFNGSFFNWCETIIPKDAKIIFLSDQFQVIQDAYDGLLTRGYTNIIGAMTLKESDPLDAKVKELSPIDLHEENKYPILDVRSDEEWNSSHIKGAIHLPLPLLLENIHLFSKLNGEVAVICHSGYRSLIALSLLKKYGVLAVNIQGGMSAWENLELPTI